MEDSELSENVIQLLEDLKSTASYKNSKSGDCENLVLHTEDEEKCEPDTDSVTEEDADTGDEEEDYQYEDERDNYDYGDQEEDGEGYVCPTCGTHSQPDERDKFRGEDLHGRSDEYIRYINEMCEGSEFHVDAYINGPFLCRPLFIFRGGPPRLLRASFGA